MIQATRSAKLMPACCASSGTSDVPVMPGWVLTSRQIDLAGAAGRVVVAEVGAADAAAAERPVRGERLALDFRGDRSGGIAAGRMWREPPGAYFAS